MEGGFVTTDFCVCTTFVCRLSSNTAYTHMHTLAHMHTNRKACPSSPRAARCPPPLQGEAQKHLWPPTRPDHTGTQRPRATESKTRVCRRSGLRAAVRIQLKAKSAVETQPHFSRGVTSLPPGPEGFTQGLCKPAKWSTGGGKGTMRVQQHGRSSPSLLHDLPAPQDPSPRQELILGARSWESWLGPPGGHRAE